MAKTTKSSKFFKSFKKSTKIKKVLFANPRKMFDFLTKHVLKHSFSFAEDKLTGSSITIKRITLEDADMSLIKTTYRELFILTTANHKNVNYNCILKRTEWGNRPFGFYTKMYGTFEKGWLVHKGMKLIT